MAVRYSSLVRPQGVWWQTMGRDERLWVGLVVIWGFAMFLMIGFIWPLIGQRQNEIRSYRIEPADYRAKVEAFIAANKVGEMDGIPVVAPPPGGDVYIQGQMFQWRPVVQLKRGQTYRFNIASVDVQHGLSIVVGPRSINYQALPGMASVVELTPDKTGTYPLVCNEYCGLGHHLMLGRIVVVD